MQLDVRICENSTTLDIFWSSKFYSSSGISGRGLHYGHLPTFYHVLYCALNHKNLPAKNFWLLSSVSKLIPSIGCTAKFSKLASDAMSPPRRKESIRRKSQNSFHVLQLPIHQSVSNSSGCRDSWIRLGNDRLVFISHAAVVSKCSLWNSFIVLFTRFHWHTWLSVEFPLVRGSMI